ncbi:MAG TPA: cyclic nucleotide-binding domain-containing protein, partial [Patescibacteria group bacterium]|nr:cyclic nucleotide-binding domain-containing protein [Patescibacteria group bacterium]
GALVVGGAILPLIAIATWPRIRHVERESMVPEEQLHLAREIPLFAPLNLSELERLASAMTPVTFLPGEVIMREGDPGDRYVIIDDGSVEVTQAGKVLRTSGHASGVGEIALLREVPRTATVTAVVLTHAYALDALAFKSAMAGPRAWAAAEAVMAERLDARSPDGPG